MIGEKLYQQISTLCAKISVEWSGNLFYKIVKGDIDNPETLVINAEMLNLQDIGTASNTEFEYDDSIIDVYDKHPHLMEEGYSMGVIHSHGTMGVFFSSTDMDEIKRSTQGIDYHLSIVVNVRHEAVARLCYYATETREYNSIQGRRVKSTSQSLQYIDLNIELPEIARDILSRKEVIAKKSRPAHSTYSEKYSGYSHYDNALTDAERFSDMSYYQSNLFVARLVSNDEHGYPYTVYRDFFKNKDVEKSLMDVLERFEEAHQDRFKVSPNEEDYELFAKKLKNELTFYAPIDDLETSKQLSEKITRFANKKIKAISKNKKKKAEYAD